MPNQGDPFLAPKAREDLRLLSRLMQAMALVWARRLLNGQVDPVTVHDIVGSTRKPPWRWSEFAGYAVLFRFLDDAELESYGLEYQILVARIVRTRYIANVAAELLAQEAEAEKAEAEKAEAEKAEAEKAEAENSEPPTV